MNCFSKLSRSFKFLIKFCDRFSQDPFSFYLWVKSSAFGLKEYPKLGLVLAMQTVVEMKCKNRSVLWRRRLYSVTILLEMYIRLHNEVKPSRKKSGCPVFRLRYQAFYLINTALVSNLSAILIAATIRNMSTMQSLATDITTTINAPQLPRNQQLAPPPLLSLSLRGKMITAMSAARD